MTASSASLPQRRREALRQQLIDAHARADQREIARVEQQWVHRYGVSSLPQCDATVDMPSAETLVPETLAPQTLVPQKLEPPSVLNRFTSALQGCLDEVGSTVEQAVSASDLSVQPSSQEVAPPPSPKLQRLRRWLPKAVDDFPQAS